jgi:hypothetical protein
MSSDILYYSNYCENCKKILQILSKSKLKNDLHFICIDRRISMPDGSINILMKNGENILLPPTITKVPALLLVNNGYHVLFGEQIYQHLQPKENSFNNKATNNQGEPSAFTFSDFSSSGITSDQYSFLDMSSDDLLAKGSGGLRQMYNYVSLNNNVSIETPPDDYVPDKIDENAMQEYISQRNK